MPEKKKVPQEKGLDHTISMKKDGYHFIPGRMEQMQTDIFITRLMGGKKAICITGMDAVKLFYDQDKIARKNAAPGYVKKTLMGMGSIHGLDGEEHKKRRELFLSVLTEETKAELSKVYTTYLDENIGSWESREPVVIYTEIKKALTASVCQWAGIPMPEEELEDKSDQLMALVFGFGNVLAIHEEGKAARKVLEDWMEKVITDVRNGFIQVPEDSAIMKVCEFKDATGKNLDLHIAAVELLNVLRPLVATSIYVTFAALALHDYPMYKEKLLSSGEDYLYMFCEEVRRFYPLTPYLGGLAAKDFEWKGCEFHEGDMVLLDVHGINHSIEVWKSPNQFDPEHFSNLTEDSKKLIAQGAGDMKTSHRCPGEFMVKQLLMDSVNFLAKTITYDVIPEQDLTYDLTKIPTIPKSGIKITNICRRV